ncbi:unnamed protein product, partial [Mesorhabditis spiculigera]
MLLLKESAAAVEGRLRCGEAPARGVRVKLWPDEMGTLVDKTLDQAWSDAEGMFRISGPTLEGSTGSDVPGIFKIYHDCGDGEKVGQRVFQLRIPEKYINPGKDVEKVFNLGTLNLEIVPHNEERSDRED